MAKNPARNRYVEVGIERESYVLRKLEEDAQYGQMSASLGKLIVLRLADYYQLMDRLATQAPHLLPPPPSAAAAPTPPTRAAVPKAQNVAAPKKARPVQEGGQPGAGAVSRVELSDEAEENADKLLNFFEPLDDDDDENEEERL